MYFFLRCVCVCSCLWLRIVAQPASDGRSGNGFGSCSHVFAGSTGGAAEKIPRNLELLSQEGLSESHRHRLAEVCEDGIIASLYDCELRISLWSAIALTGSQVVGDPKKIPPKPNHQPWHHTKTAGDVDMSCLQQQDHYRTEVLEWVGVDKGHLVPRYYAGLDQDDAKRRERRVKASYTYFNLVPQTKTLNGVMWSTCERQLIDWAKAGVNEMKIAPRFTRLYVIVGAVPRMDYLESASRGASQGDTQLFFGSGGFGKRKSNTHTVNFPLAVWTAACLVKVHSTEQGYYTVFWNWNERELQRPCIWPRRDGMSFLGQGEGGGTTMCIRHRNLGQNFLDGVQFFPAEPRCQNGIYKELLGVYNNTRKYRFT